MSNQTAALQEFEPGTLMASADVMTGARTLAPVNVSGKAYIDLDAEVCTPMPIYAALAVAALRATCWGGSCAGGSMQDIACGFVGLVRSLYPVGRRGCGLSPRGVLGVQTRRPRLRKSAAPAETQKVSEGRRMLDALAARAGAGS